MPEDQSEKPKWKHGEDVSLRKAVPALQAIRDAVEKALQAERAKLREMSAVRESLKK